jgi:hypothetical protein
MGRILLHPGLHRTGTASVQQLLLANEPVLAPHLDVLLPRDLEAVAELCMMFSKTRNPLLLIDLTAALDAIFLAKPTLGDRDLILSCAGLSGQMPGRPGIQNYAVVPFLAECFSAYFAERFPAADFNMIFTTRAPEAWLHSLWRQYLRSRRMTLDFAGFSKRFADASDLDGIVGATAQSLDPVAVYALPLEQAENHPLGPGGAILEMIDLSAEVRAGLVPVGLTNTGPGTELTKQLLALNRSTLSDDAVTAQKKALKPAAKPTSASA